ncbi:MAG: arginase [Flavobacteriales bacterium]|nr:arginase [Flavobacteriales bacterium]|tara:strand:+ start:2162 stop:3319 length:1158 start_codon:yes stop_codon:yes gene_type:complete
MQISSNFIPLNRELYLLKERWNPSQIGFQIDSHTHESFPNVDYAEIAIFNVPEYEGTENISSFSDCKVRDSLYRLYFEGLPKIVDLGTLNLISSRKENFDIIMEVCADLIEKGIIPLIIGGGQDISYAIYKAYAFLEKNITFCSVDSTFDIGLKDDKLKSSSYLSKILSHKPNHLFNFINIGYQSFFVKPEEIKLLEELNFELNRLGKIKGKIHEIEPLFRNTDFLSFDMSCVRSSSFLSNVYSTPNGFDGEEVCKIARYAGISDKISSFGIFEYNQNLDKLNQGSQLIAQMLWYFIEGFKSRKNELNPNTDNCIKYTVAFEDQHTEIEFYKSQTSGRWWMGVPFKNPETNNFNNYFVACSYDDYQYANKGQLPKRWIKTYNRFL